MKIKYAIVGSNTNPLYYDFWPIISKVWKEVFDIIPVLGLICDEDSDFIQDEYGLIKKFKSIDVKSLNLEKYFKNVIGVWCYNEKDITESIKIKFRDWAASYILAQPLHNTQKIVKEFSIKNA